MGSTMQVDHLAEKLKKRSKVNFLNSIFKNGLKKKLSHLKEGYLTIEDAEEKFNFGNPQSNLRTNVIIHSQEFYVLTGSGGALGIAEAYILGTLKRDT